MSTTGGGAKLSAPVRLRMIEALERRAQAQQGHARHMLDERLAALKLAHQQALEEAVNGAQAGVGEAKPDGQGGSPLAQLVQYITEHQGPAATAPFHGEPEALRYLRNTWSRLSADKRLTQSLAKVPDKPGPLNSHHLVHRALSTMREASPDYFHRFVSYVDALMGLDQLHGPGAAPATPEKASPATSPRPRKSARGK